MKQKTFLLAVSGGVDSMVLAFLFKKAGLQFDIAHVNYHLREEDSNLDQELVEKFCIENKMKFHLYDVSEIDNKPQNSIENWARDIRYRFFDDIRQQENLQYLVTAHHLNDQLETFVINLSKASGLKGLGGIPNNENNIIRPLLGFSKQEIYQFALDHNILFREDYTNKENIFLRNKIRNQITPLLLDTNSHFLDNFKKSISIIKDSKNFIDQQIELILKTITISKSENEIVLNKELLIKESEFVKYEILKNFNLESYLEIDKMLSADNGKIFITKTHKISIGRREIVIQPKNIELDQDEIIELKLNLVEQKSSTIVISKDYFENGEIDNFNQWIINAKNITFPLKIRRPKADDVFYPIGFNGKKKVSKFLKDKKIPIFVRIRTWILVDQDDQILGVLPYRQDRRFAEENAKTNVLIIIE
ncbi:tRNA lysidine(34) synthetase TilS [Chryseobacterium sp. T1]